MMRSLILLCAVLTLTACAAVPTPQLDASHKVPSERQQDLVACQVLAAQSAQGAGMWATDPAVRAVFFEQARQEALQQCLESKGWRWITSY